MQNLDAIDLAAFPNPDIEGEGLAMRIKLWKDLLTLLNIGRMVKLWIYHKLGTSQETLKPSVFMSFSLFR